MSSFGKSLPKVANGGQQSLLPSNIYTFTSHEFWNKCHVTTCIYGKMSSKANLRCCHFACVTRSVKKVRTCTWLLMWLCFACCRRPRRRLPATSRRRFPSRWVLWPAITHGTDQVTFNTECHSLLTWLISLWPTQPLLCYFLGMKWYFTTQILNLGKSRRHFVAFIQVLFGATKSQ